MQGTVQVSSGAPFGDGVRCIGGILHPLAVKHAVNGTATYPQAGDLSVSARSAQLGDPIPSGSIRYYQTYYRDPALGFCPSPVGDSWNVTNAIAVQW